MEGEDSEEAEEKDNPSTWTAREISQRERDVNDTESLLVSELDFSKELKEFGPMASSNSVRSYHKSQQQGQLFFFCVFLCSWCSVG